MAELKIGCVLKTEDMDEIKVIKKLGEGGQGYVYLVEYRGENKALKWYKNGAVKDEEWFINNLRKNVIKKAPTKAFLWPLALTEKIDGSFGYIMDLRPEGYYDFSKFLLGNVEFASVTVMLDAGLNIVNGFRMLHNNGYSYQDLNDGNFFINPVDGDVLICDNDNVAPFGEKSGIAGKCRYMAPAVVTERTTPNKRTDEFSLAVILFLMLLRNHPLEGEKIKNKAVMTEQREKRYYGEEPVFIADPTNASNRPVIGIHKNFISRWPQMPEYIKNAFIKAFSHETMVEDKQGVLERDWIRYLLMFKAEVNICPNCGREIRYTKPNEVCLCCNTPIQHFGYLKLANRFNVPLFTKKEICAGYVYDSYDNDECNKPFARISMNKTRTKVALQNKSDITWSTGCETVAPGEQIILNDGMNINVGQASIIVDMKY